MQRRRLAWALCLPLAVAGWHVAHVLAHSLVPAGAGVHADPHTGHDYLGLSPYALTLCVAVGLLAAVIVVFAWIHGRRRARPSLWLFAALPPLGFFLQNALERALVGAAPDGGVVEPTFLVALALQLPFAVAAAAVAYLLLVAAAAVREALAFHDPPRLVAPVLVASPAHQIDLEPRAVLAYGHGQRAPPLPRRS